MKSINILLITLYFIITIFPVDAAVKNVRTGITYNKIYLAVWAAESGDTLLVAKGTYADDWIPAADISLNIKGNYSDDFSVQFEMDSVKTIVMAGQSYAAWTKNSTSYFEYIHLNFGKHGLIVDNSIVTCKNCFVEFNTNSSYGAGILAYNNSKIILDDSYIWDNIVTDSSGKGGGIYVSNNCELITTTHASLLRNKSENGGGIYVKNGQIIMQSFSCVYGCNANENGGGIYALNSTINVNQSAKIGAAHVNVTNIAANGSGGGIYALNSTITFENGGATLDNIAAKDGGSIYVSNCTLTVKDGAKIGASLTETGNGKAGRHGGGIYAMDSTVIFTNNATLIRGIAGNSGGGMYANNCKNYFYNSVVGDSNYAYNLGGGIYVYKGKIIINNTEFKNNNAGGSGGALRLYYRAHCEINDSLFENNSAENDGGGVAISGVSTAIVNRSSFCYNTADDDGGGIYSENNSFFRLEKFEVNNNRADNNVSEHGYGGGICMFNTKAELIAGNFGSSILTNVAENGGGIYIGNSSVLTCIPSSGSGIIGNFNVLDIIYNAATENGGGICVQGNSSVISTGKIYMTSNSAENGGAIYICDDSSVKMFPENVLAKPQLYQNGARANGGGITLSNSSEFIGRNCLISGNIALNSGGGIYINSSTAIIKSVIGLSPYLFPQCELNNNSALNSGGALFGASSSYFELDGAELTNNIALAYAGGIEAYSSKMNIYNTLIIGNKSPDCGGIASLKSSRVGLYFNTFANNLTNVFDTGTAFIAGSITLTNCIVYDNIGDNFSGSGTKNIGYSDIEGGYSGEGNIAVDPEFDVDFSLMASSPCIDTGIFIGVTYDCIGNTRPYGDKVDMGAYEFVPEPGLYLLFIIYQLLFISRWRKLR